jgi:hypothetical protein
MTYVEKSESYFSKIMMNILPRNPDDREAKSPCDKNIRYPVCIPPNGTTFLTLIIVVYDKQKTALVDDPSDLINTRRLSPAESPSTPNGPETIYSCDQVTWIIHSGSFLVVCDRLWRGKPGQIRQAKLGKKRGKVKKNNFFLVKMRL